MTGLSPAPSSRPRIVNITFSLWLVSAVLTVSGGLFFLVGPYPAFLRGAGALFVGSGLALGYLAGRGRRGDVRFWRAALGLSMALVVILGLFAVINNAVGWTLIVILLVVAGVLSLRPTAQAWFDLGTQQ
jgi:hypothetical protein